MADKERRGDFIPGFSCITGEAVNHTRGEWDKLLEGTTVHRRDCYLIAMGADGLPLYEVYDEHQRSNES